MQQINIQSLSIRRLVGCVLYFLIYFLDFSANYHATPVDDWEIPIGNIVFGEAVGEGAFGKVYTATVKGVTLNYSKTDSRSELNEISLNSELPSGVTMKAAVKILQGIGIFIYVGSYVYRGSYIKILDFFKV